MTHREYLLPELLEVSVVGDTSSDAAVHAANDEQDPDASQPDDTVPTRSVDDQEPMDDEELPPPPSPCAISREAIEAALTELQRRDRAASAGDEDDDEERDDGVVIARNVSPEELERVPEHWLDGLQVALRNDGVLIALASTSSWRTYTVGALHNAVRTYATRNGLSCEQAQDLRLGPRRAVKVDVLLGHCHVGTGTLVAIAALDIVMPRATNPAMLERVAECFTLVPSLHSFVCFRFSDALVNPLAPDELRVPAFAVEFHRGTVGDTVNYRGRQLQRVRVAQIRSMGNGGVSPRALNSFHGVHRHVLIVDDVPVAQLNVLQQPSDEFPGALDRTDRDGWLDRAMTFARRVTQPFIVQMPTPLRPLHVDLPTVFHGTIVGWSLDHPLAMPAGGNLNLGAVNHGGGVIARWQRGNWTMWDVVTFVLRHIFRVNV